MDTAAGPLITVIVPLFNAADQVGEAIASLRVQSLEDFEALIIDDGSTDGSADSAADRAREAFAGDPRFRLIRQDYQDHSGARNTGLDSARGGFVAFLDGDDTLAPDFLQALHGALEREGTDWAACGIALATGDGTVSAHSALYATDDAGPPRRLPLGDARDAVRVRPFAGNKLYRRALFDGLRFAQGLSFAEDEVFWTLAARAPALAYVPEPLYRQRPARISGAADDRIFDQLRVLDRLHPLVTARHHGAEAYAMLATRLVHERALELHSPELRARFLTATWALFDRLGVVWTPARDPGISRALGYALVGEVPLSVVVLGGRPAPALAALAAQGMADMEVLVTEAEGPEALATGRPVRRLDPAGLTPASLAGKVTGRWVLLLAPGEVPLPDGLMRLVNLAEQSGAPLAIGALERATRGYHDGWIGSSAAGVQALPRHGGRIDLGAGPALGLYPALGNRLFRRDLLGALPEGVGMEGDAVSVQSMVLASALAAQNAGYTSCAVALVPDRPEGLPGMIRARRAVAALPPGVEGLPAGWRGLVFFRLVRLRRDGGVLRWLLAGVLAAGSGWMAPGAGVRPDPGTPRWFRWLVSRGRSG